MKKFFKTIILAAYIIMMNACGTSHEHENHEHSHEHEHEHSENCNHEHNHEHDHSHDHEHQSAEDEHNHADDEIIFTEHQAKDAGLTFDTIAPRSFRNVIKVSGQIVSSQGDERKISATANGIINFVNPSLTDGASVTAGQALFTISTKGISDGDLAASVRIAYETAKKEYERAEALIKDKIISQKEYEQAKAAYEKAKADLNSVGGRTAVSGATVSAPISGYLISPLVKQGEYVSVGQTIATVSQNRRLQLRADVPQRYFDRLADITSANFELPYSSVIYSVENLNGKLTSFGRTSADNSYFIPVVFEFNNPGDILAGSYSEIYLLGKEKSDVLSVPEEALTEEQGLYFVYVKLDNEGYLKKEVVPGATDGIRREILSGIKSGDIVVAKGSTHLKLAANTGQIPEGHSHSH